MRRNPASGQEVVIEQATYFASHSIAEHLQAMLRWSFRVTILPLNRESFPH